MSFDIRKPSPLLKQAALYGPEFVAQMVEYERIIDQIVGTLATRQGIPRHLLGYPEGGPTPCPPDPAAPAPSPDAPT